MRIGCWDGKAPGLTAALNACAAGDVLVVGKLDRLGRSLPGLVGLSETLKARHIGLKELIGIGAATTTPKGRLFFDMLAVIAEFERGLIRERTQAGMTAAQRRGLYRAEA